MLTDYHLHLRPDEENTTAESYFTSENVDRYLAAAAAAGIEELGVDLDDVGRVLEEEGVASFSKSFDELMTALEDKQRELAGD